MKIGTRGFAGMVPRAEPHLLDDNQAQFATNTKIWRGALQPLRATVFITTLAKLGTVKTLYRFGQNLDSDTQYWFHWVNDTDATPGPIPDDPNERTYFTESGQPPKVTDSSIALSGSAYPVAAYLLGLPTPVLSPTLTVGGTGADGAIAQTISVVYTYVSGWGEEGPPCAASALVDIDEGQTLTVDTMSSAPSGAYNVVTKRIYVGTTDSTGAAAYRFWREVAVGTTTHSEALSFSDLAESISDPYLSPPPSDLFGIMVHPDGFMIGFSGKKVCRSEVNRPHGWPTAYQDPVAHNIVGGEMIGSMCVICTTRYTYLAGGSDPINFTIDRLPIEQPCVSKRSIVSADGNVLYASPDGLISVDANGNAVNVTAELYTPDQWQALNPSTIEGYFFKGSYLGFYNGSSGFVIDAIQGEAYNLDFYASAGYSDPRRNALFLAVPNGSNSMVVRFDPPTGNASALLWRSKEYIVDKTVTMGAARVVATQYPVAFRLYADGTLVANVTVTADAIFSLPQGYRARKLYYELATSVNTEIKECLVVTLGAEFSQE